MYFLSFKTKWFYNEIKENLNYSLEYFQCDDKGILDFNIKNIIKLKDKLSFYITLFQIQVPFGIAILEDIFQVK